VAITHTHLWLHCFHFSKKTSRKTPRSRIHVLDVCEMPQKFLVYAIVYVLRERNQFSECARLKGKVSFVFPGALAFVVAAPPNVRFVRVR
jgi:hypothetical protein